MAPASLRYDAWVPVLREEYQRFKMSSCVLETNSPFVRVTRKHEEASGTWTGVALAV
jgi:hypothetical protein